VDECRYSKVKSMPTLQCVLPVPGGPHTVLSRCDTTASNTFDWLV